MADAAKQGVLPDAGEERSPAAEAAAWCPVPDVVPLRGKRDVVAWK